MDLNDKIHLVNEIKSILENFLISQKERKVSLVQLFRTQNYLDNVVLQYEKRLHVQ